MKKTGIYKKCDCCNKEIYVPEYNLLHRKNNFCSKECYHSFKFGKRRNTPSDETKKKISEALKGRTLSKETREKLSKAGKGKKSYTRTSETIERLKETIKQNGGRAGENNANWKGGISYIECVCDNCGKLHSNRMCNYNRNDRHFCSKECRIEWGTKYYTGKKAHAFRNAIIDVKCTQCGKHFKMYKSRVERANNNFCSDECDNKYRKESGMYSLENNPAWLGGLSFEPYTTEWNSNLRNIIRERDDFKCQVCGSDGKEVHHIDYDKSNCTKENLITLCRSCHGKTNHNRDEWINFFKKEEILCQ